MGGATPTKVRLVKAGSPAHQDISALGAANLALAAGPGGRIWLAWRQDHLATLKVVRTNTTVSRFGGAVSVAEPTPYGIGHVAADGPVGPLDVVVSAAAGKPLTVRVALFHTQVLAPLTVALSKASVSSATGGAVVVTVTDAGQPVPGAKVTMRGKVVTSNSKGKATLTVPKHATKGEAAVTVSHKDYAAAVVNVKVS